MSKNPQKPGLGGKTNTGVKVAMGGAGANAKGNDAKHLPREFKYLFFY